MVKNIIKMLLSLMIITLLAVPAEVSFAASDLSDDKYEKAAMILNGLGIMQSPESGFNFGGYVYRGEFAKIIVKMTGFDQIAQNKDSNAKFSDIRDAETLAYAQAASDLGFMNGTSETEFSPNEEVTYEQAVSVIVRALGYETYAQSKGGYPNGHIITAAERKILKGVSGTVGEEAISRGDLAVIIDNALITPQFITLSYTAQNEIYVISGTAGTREITLLKDNLGFEKYRVKVIDNGDLAEEKESGIRTLFVRIDDDNIPSYYTYANNEEVRFELKDTVSALGFKNTFQTVYIKDDMIYYIMEERYDAYIYDFIYEIGGKADKTPVKLKDIISKKNYITFLNSGLSYNITGDTKIYYNTSDTKAAYPMTLEDNTLPSCLGKFAKAVIEDDEISALYIYELTDDMILTEIDKTTITYDFKELKYQRIRYLDEAKEISVIIDGIPSVYEDLQEDMLINCWNVDEEYLFVASSKFIVAPFEEFSAEKAKVGEKEYHLAPSCYYSIDYGNNYVFMQGSEASVMLGREVYSYINSRGEVSYIKTEVENPVFYGVVLDVYKKDFGNNIALFRSVGSGTNAEGINVSYPLKLKNSEISAETAALYARDAWGNGIYKFTLNGKGEVIKISRPNWKPYFDHIDFPRLSTYIFPAGTQNPITKLYSGGAVTNFNVTYNRIKVRPMVFTLDTSTDSTTSSVANLVGPRAGLKGNYLRQATQSGDSPPPSSVHSSVPASDRLYIDRDNNVIQDSEIFIAPEKLVPIVSTTAGAEHNVYLNNDSILFSLIDNEGYFNPSIVKMKDISEKSPGGVNMLIENNCPYSEIAVILRGRDTIESTVNMRLGYVKELKKVINEDNLNGLYTATIYTEDYAEKIYTIEPKNANGIVKGSIIAFRENGVVLDAGNEAENISADVQGNGYIRVYYTYNPADIKNDGTNIRLESAEHDSCSAFTSVVVDTNNYKKLIRYDAIAGMDDRIVNRVDFIDGKVIQIRTNDMPTVFPIGAKVLVYKYDSVNGKTTEGNIYEVDAQRDRVWIIKRDGIIRAIFYY